MKQERGTQSALTTDAALAALADLWLWDPSFMVGTRIEKENRLRVAWQKLLAETTPPGGARS
jgi:hypothetical protein